MLSDNIISSIFHNIGLSPKLGVSSQNNIKSPRNRVTSPRNRVTSPRNRVTSPRNRVTSPRNRVTSPRNRLMSPRSINKTNYPMIPLPIGYQPIIPKLNLKENQYNWAQKALNIIKTNKGYLDTSMMGRGKTYIALWISQQLNLPLLIVGPVSSINVWLRTADEYGITIFDTMSYATLRGSKKYLPQHQLLIRTDENGITKFTHTQEYLDLVAKGVFVILDEAHDIKNDSYQYMASSALLDPIVNRNNPSKYAILTATPFDKIEHAVNFLRLIGYIKSELLYDAIYKRDPWMKLHGMQELIDRCNEINHVLTEDVLNKSPKYREYQPLLSRTKEDFEDPRYNKNQDPVYIAVYHLFRYVVKPSISGYIPKPKESEPLKDIKNGFYEMNIEDELKLEIEIDHLKNYVIKDKNIGKSKPPLVKILQAIEYAKVNIFSRKAKHYLDLNIQNKVIICVNYHQTIKALEKYLERYHPIILTGKTSRIKRDEIEEIFNTDLNNRLIIMITKAGGVSISLHDTVGNSPRFMLISPSFNLIPDFQATGRIHRDGVKSIATIRMIYGKKSGSTEMSILSTISEKSVILSGTLDPEQLEEIILPKDYPIDNEE